MKSIFEEPVVGVAKKQEQKERAFAPLNKEEMVRIRDPAERYRAELARCASDSDEKEEEDEAVPLDSKPTTTSVGASLLRGMQRGAHVKSPAPYIPPSTGGFVSTTGTTAAADNNLRQIVVGTVLAKTTTSTAVASQTTASAASKPSTSVVAGGIVFKRDAEISLEEATYGRCLDAISMDDVCEVTRVDAQRGEAEVRRADGTRAKVLLSTMRIATDAEKKLFVQWHQTGAKPALATTADATRKRQRDEGEGEKSNNSTGVVSGSTSPLPSTLWWAQPRLVVRVVDEAMPELRRKKFRVVSVRPKEGRVFLADFAAENGIGGGGGPAPQTGGYAVGLDSVQTVLPAVNESGMVVLGEHRGDIVRVVSREKADGQVVSLTVQSPHANQPFVVAPEELCCFV